MKKTIIALLMAPALFTACLLNDGKKETENQNTAEKMEEKFSDTLDGKPVRLYTLKNKAGMEVGITNFGATIVSIRVPDKNGVMDDVTLGYDSIQGYYNGSGFFGCAVGRYANRIAKGKFTLNGKEYTLFKNNGENSLHGGKVGFNRAVWQAKTIGNGVEMTHTSPDGDEGYPGNLTVTITYTLTDSNELKIGYRAVTDQPTVLNLSNHSYFNLAGQGKGDILGHSIQIFAETFTPVDTTLIPTGEYMKVEGTAFDFRQPHSIGERIDDLNDQQIRYGGGYDHNFVLDTTNAGKLKKAAVVTEPNTGRVMEVFTTEPGVQFYTGNFLNGKEKGKGSVYNKRNGFCLETQHFPDSPNQPEFPSTVLEPGKEFSSETIYKFSVNK